jgi:hypothetical protein
MMKLKAKLISAIAGSVLMLTTGIGIATAAQSDCSSAVVSQVGILPTLETTGVSKYIASFDCLDSPEPWSNSVQFKLSSDLGDSGYATLLTAVSLGQTVYLRVADTTFRSLVLLLYLNDTPVP